VLTIVSVNALLKSDHYGIFDDITNHPLKDTVKIRFLTQLTKKDLKPIKMLLKRIESDFDFKGRDPERTSSICPRMLIKDRDEILLFISDPNEVSSKNKIEAVLCTNSKSIINSFHGVFQDLWSQGKPILRKIDELESGIKQPIMELIKEPQKAKIKYFKALDEGKTEIIMVTSSKHLHELAQNIDLIKKWRKKGLSTKILAPITNENLRVTKKLLNYAEVKHIPLGHKETTIVDGKEFFQFHSSLQSGIRGSGSLNFKNVFFTNDQDYIDASSKHLFEIWEKTHFPSENIISVSKSNFNPLLGHHCLEEKSCFMENMQYHLNEIDENKVLKKINEEKKRVIPNKSYEWSSEIRYFGTRAFASFPPIQSLSLPKMIIGVV
ncbi:MAG: hypothetical protein P8X84_02565, partial [Candidatus Bathyarchaeota archaeon]